MTDPRAMPDLRATPSPLEPLAQVAEARERAIALLTDAYAYDTLTEAEFEWRLGELLRGESASAMDALVADLTGGRLPAVRSESAPSSAPLEGRIVGFMSESRRKGPWRVPHHLKVLAVMSNIVVDLRYAVVPSDCAIEITAIMANVTLIVSPTMVVDFDALPIMGTARSEALTLTASGARAPVRVHGTAFMAEVRVKVRDLWD
jgi:hypothetical protein